METKNYDNCLTITSDSSDDDISNEDPDDDRRFSLDIPNQTTADSGDEGFCFGKDDGHDYLSPPQSNYSPAYSGGSSYSLHSHNMYNNYEPSSHPELSRKRTSDHFDSDYGSVDDTASTISSSSSSSCNNKKRIKKYNFDMCVKEVEPSFQVTPIAKNIMKKMGFQEGAGLGKHQQGITAPIEASKQRGRSGIGHKVKQLEPANLVWDSTYEEISVEEVPVWLEGALLPGLSQTELHDWLKEGPKILEMESFSDFCDPDLLHDILESKTVFDDLDDKELLRAVKQANPFETISNGIFLNRAAMKMANLDRVFDFMFTNPRSSSNVPINEMELLYFADVCAGPGGFSEYVLWKKKWKAKGIGFTLRNECDFKLDKFLAGTPETFEPFYGAKEDGDIFDPMNIESLTEFVMTKTDNIGVHFMMADGGFSVAGKENIQELMSKQLYLCQLLVALCIVRTDGHFVCKLFDVFSPFSVGLIYLMYRSFKKICLHKPNSSRPANSERYIICKHKRSDCEDIRQYMFDINLHLLNLGEKSSVDVNECVPMAILMSDKRFINYIVNSNNDLGRRQLVHLKKVIAFCRDKSLTEPKQSDLRLKCLEYWGVPSTTRMRKHDNTSPEAMAEQILQKTSYDFAAEPGEELTSEEKLKSQFPSVLDWTCIPVGNHNECHFYIGCKGRVYMLRRNGKGWTNLNSRIKLELSPGTIVYGEIVEEVTGSYRSQTREKFFHIIDAISLGDQNIMQRSYTTRIKLCKLYAKALYKSRPTYSNGSRNSSCTAVFPMTIRANDYFEMKRLMAIFERVQIRINKLRHPEILIGLKDELPTTYKRIIEDDGDEPSEPSDALDKYYFPVKGILFYKTTKNPWTVHYSKKHCKCYYYRADMPSTFEPPEGLNSSAIDCFVTRKLWTWDQGVGIKKESPKENVLHMNQLLAYITNLMH